MEYQASQEARETGGWVDWLVLQGGQD
jgi:hypothetical protein